MNRQRTREWERTRIGPGEDKLIPLSPPESSPSHPCPVTGRFLVNPQDNVFMSLRKGASLTHSLAYSLTHSLTLTLTLTRSHPHPQDNAFMSLCKVPLSLSHTHARSLAHSL